MANPFLADAEPLIPIAARGRYSACRVSGELLLISGLGPLRADGSFWAGKVGRAVTVETAYQHARLVARHVVALLRETAYEKRVEALRVFGMVNADPDFGEHTAVIDGFSDHLVETFGERGHHARSAVGMASLPHGMTVEIEAQFRLIAPHQG